MLITLSEYFLNWLSLSTATDVGDDDCNDDTSLKSAFKVMLLGGTTPYLMT